MSTTLLLLATLLLLFPNRISGSLPISFPYDWEATHGQPPYNLIDTDPICYYGGYCPMFFPGLINVYLSVIMHSPTIIFM